MSRNRAAAAVGLGILLSRIAGLVRERVFAYYLGNTDAAGALRAAIRIPNLLQNLFGEGVLSASFIPVYSRLLGRNETDHARQVATRTLAWLLFVTIVLALLGILASPFLVDILAPGFDGETRNLCVKLVRIIFPGTGVLVLSAWCLGILNSHRKFFLSYVAPVVWNGAIIAVLMWRSWNEAHPPVEEMVMIAAWGIVIGSVLQWLVQLPLSLKLNHGLAWGNQPSTGDREVARNFMPAVFSRGVAQLNAYVDQILSSFLGAQVVSGFAYAQTLTLLPLSLFGMAITASELPELSRESGSEEGHAKLKERLLQSRERLFYFIVPSVVAQVVLGNYIVATLFQTGQFTARDTQLVWAILGASSLGLLATSESRLLASVFWAIGETKRPAAFAFYRLCFSAVLGVMSIFYFAPRYGLEPAQGAVLLALSGSLAAYFEYGFLRRVIQKRLGMSLPQAPIFKRLGSALLAAGAALVVAPYFEPLARPWAIGGGTLAVFGGLYLALTGGVKKLKAMRRGKPSSS